MKLEILLSLIFTEKIGLGGLEGWRRGTGSWGFLRAFVLFGFFFTLSCKSVISFASHDITVNNENILQC